MKKFWKLALVAVFAVSLATGCGCEKKEEKKDDNNLSDVSNTSIPDTSFANLDVVDFAIIFEDNISSVYFEVQNNTQKDVTYDSVICDLYDKDGEIIYSFSLKLGTIEAESAEEYEYKVDLDLTSAVSVELDVEKK